MTGQRRAAGDTLVAPSPAATDAAPPTAASRAGRVRRGGLALVMVGALSVSVRGQVEAVTPLLGGMSIVLALTNDLAAFLALNEVISSRRAEVRRWAWAVLGLASGTAAGLNTWHALAAGLLPAVWAVVVGIGPVLLALLLSHLVALVLADPAPGPAEQASAVVVEPAPHPPVPAAAPDAAPHRPSEPAPTGRASADLTGGSNGHLPFAVVPPPTPPRSDPPVRGGGLDARVERLAAQLRTGAELTGAMVAEQLGCSERTGRRLLRQAVDQTDADHREVPLARQVTG